MLQLNNKNKQIIYMKSYKNLAFEKSFWIGVFCFILLAITFGGCNDNSEIVMDGDRLESIRIPEGDGSPVLLDGTFTDGEWDDAFVVAIHDSVDLLFKKNQDHIFIGIKCPQLIGPSIDVYLAHKDDQIHHFHISAQLAERVWSIDSSITEDPPYIWRLTKDWYANEFRWDQQKMQRIMASEGKTQVEAFGESVYPFDGVEMQFRHSKLPFPQWSFRIEIQYPPNYNNPLIYPNKTSIKTLENWLKLLIDD